MVLEIALRIKDHNFPFLQLSKKHCGSRHTADCSPSTLSKQR